MECGKGYSLKSVSAVYVRCGSVQRLVCKHTLSLEKLLSVVNGTDTFSAFQGLQLSFQPLVVVLHEEAEAMYSSSDKLWHWEECLQEISKYVIFQIVGSNLNLYFHSFSFLEDRLLCSTG